ADALEVAPHAGQHLGVANERVLEKIALIADERNFAQPAPVAAVIVQHVIPFVVGVVGILAATADHQTSLPGDGTDFPELLAHLLELAELLARQLCQVHAVAVGAAVALRRFDLGTLLDELAQFLGRERPALAALGLLARDIHLNVLIGLAAAFAILSLAVFAAGLRFRAFDSLDQVVAHPLGFFFAERIVFAAFARIPNQLLEPVVEGADLADAGHDVGATLANGSEVSRSHPH